MSKPLTEEQRQYVDQVLRHFNRFLTIMGLLLAFCFYMIIFPDKPVDESIPEELNFTEAGFDLSKDSIVDGIDFYSGLIEDEHFRLVKTTCSSCHSLKLVTQNRQTREGWKKLIVWMQETQKLWDLGDNESKILDYLEKNYAPTEKGRRENLVVDEWYTLDP